MEGTTSILKVKKQIIKAKCFRARSANGVP